MPQIRLNFFIWDILSKTRIKIGKMFMIKKMLFILILFMSVFITGCSAPIPKPVKIKVSSTKIEYLKEVKPILDKRCVTCHSCYNSPCQAKYSSFEGIDRGASKLAVYDALRLNAMKPTRLFIDAKSTQEWRQKDFFSLTHKFDTNASYNDSIMIQMLYDKKIHPEIVGSYKPEQDTLICPKNPKEMGKYLEDKPKHGMPYGMPAIKDAEYNTLAQWLAQGAKGPTQKEQEALVSPSHNAKASIVKWESFLNKKDAKHVMSARYLYEHLFLAHVHFTSTQREFYRLVRSSTASPEKVNEIPTVRPFDKPDRDKFYYRFEKIHATIVHKTHMVVELNASKLARFKELFIEVTWAEKPHVMSYDTNISANPFLAFAQIPVRSRYQFLLDNAHYVVMNFIRGPVCRGQIALNVIHDHFWVMFQDPEYDISVLHPEFLLKEAKNLSMPIETSTQKLLQTFSDKYRDGYRQYFADKEKLIRKEFPEGQDMQAIWRGNTKDDSPLLTIYRHFDSASVHHGALGSLPRTAWVIDYPQFERIYYSLVAGYDVFGNISHQTNIRRYMDFLRVEGELNFLTYMPKKERLKMFKSWYINDGDVEDLENIEIQNNGEKIVYKTSFAKSEFFENIVKHHLNKMTNIKLDKLNYFNEYMKVPKMPKKLKTLTDVENAVRSLTVEGTGFLKVVTDSNVNTMTIRLIMPDKTSKVYTLVINRWHDNVNSMFTESSTLNAVKDTIDFLPGFVGSYPNAFAVIDYTELADFFDIIDNYDGSLNDKKRFEHYYIGRSDKDFWQYYDWFEQYFKKVNPIGSGILDLNRYYYR